MSRIEPGNLNLTKTHKHDMIRAMSNSNVIELFPDASEVPEQPPVTDRGAAIAWAMQQRDREKPQTRFDTYKNGETRVEEPVDTVGGGEVVIRAPRAAEVAGKVGRHLSVLS